MRRCNPEPDGGTRWNDPQLTGHWIGQRKLILYSKDTAPPALSEFLRQYGPLASDYTTNLCIERNRKNEYKKRSLIGDAK